MAQNNTSYSTKDLLSSTAVPTAKLFQYSYRKLHNNVENFPGMSHSQKAN